MHLDTALILNNPEDIATLEGQNVTIHCSGISNPASNITWLKNGLPIIQGTNYSFANNIEMLSSYGQLTIYNVQVADEGIYQCKLQNEIGITLSGNAVVTIYRKCCFI